jgi:hypothetical protein
LGEEILGYLRRHPDAADTLSGIANWWLIRQRYLDGIQQVEVALQLLIKMRVVEKIDNTDGTTIYRAAKGKRKYPANSSQ